MKPLEKTQLKLRENATVIILAGGQGTRVRNLYPGIPKPMIPVAGKPFIEWVISYFQYQQLRKFVISLGYLADLTATYFEQRTPTEMTIKTICEPAPLGTGGATLLAQQAASSSDPLIVTNGDSLALVDLYGAWQQIESPQLDGVIVGVYVQDTSRYGALKIGTDGALLSFQEKQGGQGLINAGIYFLKQRLLRNFPMQTPLSLEVDVFPALLKQGAKLGVYACEAPFLDIGTPQTLREADCFIRKYFQREGRE